MPSEPTASETSAFVSPRLVELDFQDDIKRLTDDFIGREWIFDEIDKWLRSSETFFILTGEPGIGKSAIVARLTQIRDDIKAYHFCIAGQASTIVPGTVLRSLAAQLGKNLADYGEALARTIKPTYVSIDVKQQVGTMNGGQLTGVVLKNLTLADPKQELESLLTAPLRDLPAPARPVLIILDSLDEAFTYSSKENFVTLLAGLENLPLWVRIVLTSRPEKYVLSYFSSVPKHLVAAESQLNRDDLRRYVRNRVNKLTLSGPLQAASKPNVLESFIAQVAGDGDEKGLADGNFLYTKILLDDVENGIQPLDDLAALPKSLDEIYQRFLLRLAADWKTTYRPLVAVLAIAREPLTHEQLLQFGKQSARLVGGHMSETVLNDALNVLVQFLDVKGARGSEQYSLFHQSLRDYLGDRSRSGTFTCPPQDGHNAIAEYYLEHVSKDWSKCDEYGLKHIPVHLRGSGRTERLNELLVDFKWLSAKLQATDVSALLADYELTDDPETKLMGEALRLSAHVLAQDKKQLASQLLGRLQNRQGSHLQRFLEQAVGYIEGTWLQPLTTSLESPASLPVRSMTGHTDYINAVAMMPESRQAVSVSDDATIRVWDIDSGKELQTLKKKPSDIWSRIRNLYSLTVVAVMPNGKILFGDSSGVLWVWDYRERTTEHMLHDDHQASAVSAIAIMPDARSVVSADESGKVLICDLATMEHRVSGIAGDHVPQALPGHTERVNALAMATNGRLVASASADHTIKLWDLQTGVADSLDLHGEQVTGIALLRDEKRAVSIAKNGTLKVWMLPSGEELWSRMDEGIAYTALAVTSDDRWAFTGSETGTLTLWDLLAGKHVLEVSSHAGRITAIAITPDDKQVVSASHDGMLKVWTLPDPHSFDLSTRIVPKTSELTRPCHAGPVQSVAAFSSRGLVLSASKDAIKSWRVDNGEEVPLLSIPGDEVMKYLVSMKATPDGRRVVVLALGHTLALWNLKNGYWSELGPMQEYEDPATALTLTEDGKIAVTGCESGELRIWDLDAEDVIKYLPAHKKEILALAVSDDGKKVVSSSRDGDLAIWDLSSGQRLLLLPGHSGLVTSIALTPYSGRVISGDSNGTLKVWDLISGQELQTLEGHLEEIRAVAIAPSGQWAISGGHDRTLRVWDLTSSKAVARLDVDSSILACIFADDLTVVAGDVLGHIHFLRLRELR